MSGPLCMSSTVLSLLCNDREDVRVGVEGKWQAGVIVVGRWVERSERCLSEKMGIRRNEFALVLGWAFSADRNCWSCYCCVPRDQLSAWRMSALKKRKHSKWMCMWIAARLCQLFWRSRDVINRINKV